MSLTVDKALAKVKIASLDGDLHVEAQYNPKELQIDRSIPWTPHDKNNADGLQLEFTGGQGRELGLELFFDGYETDGVLGKKGETVASQVDKLNEMASVRKPTSTVDDERRPHHCFVIWGGLIKDKNSFQCVITSIQTKYTMFKSDGTPLRATCTVKLKEASRVTMSKDSAKNAPPKPAAKKK
jgi:hypothetical protein